VLSILQFVKMLLKPFLSLTVGAVILALGLLVGSLMVSYFLFLPIATYVGPSPAALSWISTTALLAVLTIPAFKLMLGLTRWFSSYKLPRHINSSLRIVWAVSFVICGFAAWDLATDHRDQAELSQVESYYMDGDRLDVGVERNKKDVTSGLTKFFDLSIGNEGVINDNVKVYFIKSQDDKVHITTERRARGDNMEVATMRADGIQAQYRVNENQILLPNYFEVDRLQKVRGQRMIYTIAIPEGKQLTIDPSLHIRHGEGFEEDCHCYKADYTWTMGHKGLYSKEWIDKYRATKTIDLGDVSTLNMEGGFAVEIVQGNKNEAILSGRKDDINNVQYVHTASTGSFLHDSYMHRNLKLTVTVANVTSVNATRVKGMTMTNLVQDDLEINYNSNYDLNVYGDVKRLSCQLAGTGESTFIGSGDQLEIKLKHANIDAQKYKANQVLVTGDSRGTSEVYAMKGISYDSRLSHELDVYGQPTVNVIERDLQ